MEITAKNATITTVSGNSVVTIHIKSEEPNKSDSFLQETQSTTWLQDGLTLGEAICRVISSDKKVGNGFLVSPIHVITTFHQVRNNEVAKTTKFQFNYKEGKQNKTYFGKSVVIANEELDFSIVMIDIPEDNEIPFIKFVVEPLEIHLQQPCVCIGHPNGGFQVLSTQGNKIEKIFQKVIHYSTNSGESFVGSPVFDTKWNLLGICHSSKHSVASITNEVVRMDAILEKIRNLNPEFYEIFTVRFS